MTPFRSRLLAAIVFAILVLGLLGTVADAAGIPTNTCFPEDPWGSAGLGTSGFPEDPWPGVN